MGNVIAVMSSYNPDHVVLENVEHNMRQIDRLFIVDDGSKDNQILDSITSSSVQIIKLGTNQGIAKALNVGIVEALKVGADYILFLDQDSKLGNKYVEQVIKIFHSFKTSENVGIVVPGKINEIPSIPRQYLSPEVGLVPSAIQSGMVISRECISSIGLLDERLFIDAVDTEFCLRSTSKNWAIAAGMRVNLEHSLGQKEMLNIFGIKLIPRGQGIEFNGHSPFRRYYITRNNVDVFLRYLFISPGLILRQGKAEMIQATYAIISGPQRLKNLIAICCGFIHGLVRKRGKIPTSLMRIIQ